ncbi:hypothetical protein D3C87_1837180 [compost metagenome]
MNRQDQPVLADLLLLFHQLVPELPYHPSDRLGLVDQLLLQGLPDPEALQQLYNLLEDQQYLEVPVLRLDLEAPYYL